MRRFKIRFRKFQGLQSMLFENPVPRNSPEIDGIWEKRYSRTVIVIIVALFGNYKMYYSLDLLYK